MTIRRAVLADVPRLVALGRAAIAAHYADLIADDPVQLDAFIAQIVTTPTAAVFVAEQDGTIVGLIGLVRYVHGQSGVLTAGEVAWWVEPWARGCGLALLARAERWAAEMGAQQIQMIAPATHPRVGRLYERRGYRPLETSYQAPVTAAMSAITVVDDVLPDVDAYGTATRAQVFGDVEPSPGVVFHGMADAVSDALPAWIRTRYPSLTPTTTFVRQSPAGQEEPHFIHTDQDMGDWTAIGYLTDLPADGDGTTFWRWRETGCIQSVAVGRDEQLAEWTAWRDRAQWEPWTTVAAQPNRVVLFPAAYFHSRALPDNYGAGDTARLIQVVFGTGTFPPEGV